MKEKLFVLLFLIVFSLITTPIIKPKTSANHEFNHESTYKVIKGDSLWTIGMRFDKKNIEEFLFNTKKINKLDNSEIFVGQILIIP
tara:strand:+ start:38 stop:295 length:258 start_codon:yes stop_codon:yes gene_type:complete